MTVRQTLRVALAAALATLAALAGVVSDHRSAFAQIDISAEWNLVFSGDGSFECLANIDQTGTDLAASSDCALTSGTGRAHGSIDPASGAFTLSGQILSLAGVASSDGTSLNGTWTGYLGYTGTFEGTRKPPPATQGAMAVDCDVVAAGVQASCRYAGGARFFLGIQITEAPPGGYAGWQFKIDWPDDTVTYHPTSNPQGEALWPSCSVPARSESPDVSYVVFGCVAFPWPLEPFTKTGLVAQFEFECPPDLAGPVELALPPRPGDINYGALFVDVDEQIIDPALSGASVSCIPDSDSDGCHDELEAGANPLLGGGRDPNDYWDFFDTPPRDRSITTADIARLVQRFGSNDAGGATFGIFDRFSDPLSLPNNPYLPSSRRENYHPAFDRSPAPPALSGPADGVIAAGDIALIVRQFGHSCAGG